MPATMKFWIVILLAASAIPVRGQVAIQPPSPEWIQHPAEPARETIFFRKEFQARLPLLKAILLGACDGQMSVYLNGEPVGEITGRQRATSLDVTRFIRQGSNVLAIEARSSTGTNAISLLLELNGDYARKEWLVSDSSWLASGQETRDWKLPNFATNGWSAARSIGRVDAGPGTNPFDPKAAFDAYDSWKLALGTNTATDPAGFTLLPGFKAELLRSARPEEGSWISMAFDPQGRLTIAREKRGLIRIGAQAFSLRDHPPANERTNTDEQLGVRAPLSVEVIEDTLLECRGLLYAYGALYVNANNSKGFYRLRDTKGDGHFDEVKLLLRTEGGVGHGRNHVVLGPDGSIYLVHGNNVTLTRDLANDSPLKAYQNDTLLPCPFDDALFDGDVKLPAGHILRTDPEGKHFELFAGGFRNPLDVAFNPDGEMFTFDADMEWDVGSPWYRPNRVNHVISGADLGWRRGTSKWPDYLPDTLPSTLDIGLASPTGIEFGTKSHFPPPYNDALFISDWAYGRILAVHFQPRGASYTASSELFVSGRPLNVTDVTFGPDGAMYFITGGRGTQSGLYRLSYVGPKVASSLMTRANRKQASQAKTARELRHRLEALHGPSGAVEQASRLFPGASRPRTSLSFSSGETPGLTGGTPVPLASQAAVAFIWSHLGDSDPSIRHAARVALEHQPVSLWQSRALGEKRTAIALTALLALTHVGSEELQETILTRLNAWHLGRMNEAEQLQAFRIYEIAFSRWGKPGAAMLSKTRHALEPLYPARDWHLNHRLCPLLIYLESPSVIGRTLELASRTERPEDLMQYLFFLRYVHQGWTIAQRENYFRALERAEQKQGARDYYSVLKRVRDEVVASLSTEERNGLKPVLPKLVSATLKLSTNTAPFVREWRMEDFDLSQPLRGRSFSNGTAAFTNAQCNVCHRFGNEGGFIGPDLTAVGSRFDTRVVLESILEPSKVIDEKFRNTVFRLKDGTSVAGVIEQEDAQKLLVRESPFADKPVELLKKGVLSREPSAVSPMPAGLANTLQRDQVLDLLAFLQSGGDANHPAFRTVSSPGPAVKLVTSDASGTVTMLARDAITHGATLRYEPATNKNCLGFWTNPKDWAEWQFALAQPGTFEVEVWQGCGKGQGGSEVIVEVGLQQLTFVVEETGHFQIFVPRRIGRVQFTTAGTYSLALKPQRKQAGAVMDIQKVRLIPVRPQAAASTPSAKRLLEAEAEAHELERKIFLLTDMQFPGKRSRWFGFDRYDFQVDGHPVLVVAPSQAAPGKPWAWHGEFFGHKPNPDLALLGRGFHIAYMSVPDMLGCPAAVRHWNALYGELTEKYGLAKKAALVGLSRGGLYCYNWAAANPDKTACIYGDAPVCDFKSWPGGFGQSKRSDRDWQLVLDRYGFKSEAEARAYTNNPVDNLAPLAKANIPLLHVYGDADEIVPWEENTGVTAERYRKLGGSIALIAKAGGNHHPHGLDDSTPIVDFIWQNAASPAAKAWLSNHGGGPLDSEARPLIRKLGTIDLDLVETTPIAFRGKLYRFEWVRQGYWNNQHKTNYFRFIDHETGAATEPFADGHEFGSAFVEGDSIYVTGTQGRSRVNMFASRDLKTWESWPVFVNPKYGIYNTSLCKADGEYVLMFEIDRPSEEAGVPFTARFARSPDLRNWTLTPPECNYAKDRYTAPHCLRWLDGWFYDFYLEAHDGYEMRVVRSRDLKQWEPSALNPVLRASPFDKVIANPALTEAQRARVALAVNLNNSDIDFCEWQGRLMINYSWGNQQGVEHLAEAAYDGTLAQFLNGWFPKP